MPYAIVNSFLPVASDFSVAGRQITLPAVRQTGAQVCPTHIIVTDAEMTALEALDQADIRAVRLRMFTKLSLALQPDASLGFTSASQAALAAAIAPTINHAPLRGGV